MFRKMPNINIETENLTMRLPQMIDRDEWINLRRKSADFLMPWEPNWQDDHLTKKSFTQRVEWARKSVQNNTAIPLFIIRRSDQLLVGAITLDNIRRGPAQTATIGYWTGEPYIRQGLMGDALPAVVNYAFETLDLSRIEAACLPKNLASRRVLEKSGFKYEGVAQSYLQISGRWRNHVLYANLRNDRRGKSIAG